MLFSVWNSNLLPFLFSGQLLPPIRCSSHLKMNFLYLEMIAEMKSFSKNGSIPSLQVAFTKSVWMPYFLWFKHLAKYLKHLTDRKHLANIDERIWEHSHWLCLAGRSGCDDVVITSPCFDEFLRGAVTLDPKFLVLISKFDDDAVLNAGPPLDLMNPFWGGAQ